MKGYQTRHQLFRPEGMSRRLEHLAKSSGRARSEILVEALDDWFNRRQAPKRDEAIGIRLTRIERTTAWLRRNQALVREVLARMVRHQHTTGALTPATPADQPARAPIVDQLTDEH